jgi:hypothetical protein
MHHLDIASLWLWTNSSTPWQCHIPGGELVHVSHHVQCPVTRLLQPVWRPGRGPIHHPCSFVSQIFPQILNRGLWQLIYEGKRKTSAGSFQTGQFDHWGVHFSSLVYLVEDAKEAHVKFYVSGLNPQIVSQAMSKEWRRANMLDAQMDLAIKAAAQLNLLSLLPSDNSQPLRHCPFFWPLRQGCPSAPPTPVTPSPRPQCHGDQCGNGLAR